MTDARTPCTGADDPADRCGLHHPIGALAPIGGDRCCCDGPWHTILGECGGEDGRQKPGAPVSLRARLHAHLGYSVADAAQDVDAHTARVMPVIEAELDRRGEVFQRML